MPYKRGSVVVSAFLQHSGDNKGALGIRTRIFSGDGKLDVTFDMFGVLEQADLGSYFGGQDEILSVTCNEEHAYNVRSEVWLVSTNGAPKRLLSFPGIVEQFRPSPNARPGIVIDRETYDGQHPQTKGRVKELWTWDPETKSLIEPRKQ
jgi:hypothetical protein